MLRVKRSAAHDEVDPVLEGVDDGKRTAAQVVIGRQEPGRRASVDDLFVHLGVALGHQREKGRLRLRGNAVVLVDDLDAQADPVAPGDRDVAGRSSCQQVMRKRMPEQVLNRELRVSVLHGPADFLERVPGKQAHQGRHRRLAAARRAEEDHSPRRHQVQQRQQHERRVARLVVQLDLQLIALEASRCAGLQLREGSEEGIGANPVIGLAKLRRQSIVRRRSELEGPIIRRALPGRRARN